MTQLKYAVMLAAGIFSLNATASEKFIPSLLNFSVLYDFMPVQGKVKQLRTHILNDDDGVGYDIKISLSSSGCIESFERTGRFPDGEVLLSRQGNTLSGTVKGQPLRYDFDGKCNIVSSTADGGVTHYTTNAEGQIVSSTLNGNPLAAYKYSANGKLIHSEYYLNGKFASSSEIAYTIESERPYNTESESTFAGGKTSSAWNSCVYDEKMLPTRCISNGTVTENGVRQNVISVASTEVDFY